MYLLCAIRSLYYSAVYSHWPFGPYISGHDYHEQDDGVIRCNACGRIVD